MEVQSLINGGLKELARVLRPGGSVKHPTRGGRLLVKCSDYVSSGQLQIGSHHTLATALDIGFRVHDRFIFDGSQRPQPKGRRVEHARHTESHLFVLRAPR